ncbi:putative harbinger transposase-derived protein [Helianthus annuus]|uniref:Harbinger transposase-derived protein n=1 Tax=Helianthus annuus TaxID=4232 RepID=A0A9K3ICM3_HELAN|nr:putative harbinger transposase-derived protein [Helianthus annuus]KAJ0552649.1 putative harbinger transposase-derived protein [Helianthus annuus]KAJ0721575.1 putative harbinger transposase-derived protein [Helianthus annuus]
MVCTFFHKLLRYLSSEDDSNDDLDEDVKEQCTRKLRKFIRRNHIQGHERLYRDYFAENPVYPSNLFRLRFRMSRPLFLRILDRSSVFTELTQGRAPPVNYTVNGHDYIMGYYLADGIYPKNDFITKREQE